MRITISLVIIFEFFTLESCVSKEGEDKGQSWINVKYIECLKNSLPCDCEKITQTYYALSLDTDSQSKGFGIALSKFEQMEPNMYSITKIGVNEYIVHKSREDTTSWAKLIIKGEQLQFIENDTLSKFAKSKEAKGYNVQHYLDDNVTLLNEAFTSRKYPKLEKIVNEDSLKCDCNKWLGNVNVLYVKGAPKSWIMEIRNDTLIIKKITNFDRDPDDPIQTEKVVGYMWR